MNHPRILLAATVLVLFGCTTSDPGDMTGSGSGSGGGGGGTTGSAGTTGTAGVSGNAGTTGSAGASGSAGTTGNAGTTGAAGGAGTTGGAGPSGTAGSGNAGRGGNGGASGTGAGGSGGRGGSAGGGAAGTSAGGRGGNAGNAGTGGGASPAASFFIGADITWVQADEARGATYSDGTRRDVLQILKDHGFNAIRLRTFVDPRASDGYDRQNGFADLAHTITFGKRIKAAGMGFLLDFHYSDNWADPGKQCIPVAWQGMNATQMATAVHDYTKDAITQLVAAGARPDMVQVGNEITPGMLLHICDSAGSPTSTSSVNGSSSSWTNLGSFLKAGSNGVKEVDSTILVALHIDRGNAFATSRDFIRNAMNQGVVFDAFGESCYTAYQGQPSAWMSTFTQLVTAFPNLKFFIAEYGPEQRAANDVMFNLPNRAGIGTFNWEPTHNGAWNTGHVLFSVSGNNYTATADLSLYDPMKTAYASRL